MPAKIKVQQFLEGFAEYNLSAEISTESVGSGRTDSRGFSRTSTTMPGEEEQAASPAVVNPMQPQSSLQQTQFPPRAEGEIADLHTLVSNQKLQIELQQREMQIIKGASDQHKLAWEQSRSELSELREQLTRYMNLPAPSLVQPQLNINQLGGQGMEYQYIAEPLAHQIPGNSNFSQPENIIMSARNYGAPLRRGPGEGTGGTPSEPHPFGAQPTSGSSEQQGRLFAESAETPMIGRQPTAQTLGGTLPWGAQTAGENQPFGVGTGLHQHANHSSGESHGGGQCCTKQQLPPLEPFDPE
ncbi:MAG: hypothetical protein GY820_03280, partial [Gammaproteobacteria bacterium]|nr:hypothetical protein [Gammaproteobacteria bacterium]